MFSSDKVYNTIFPGTEKEFNLKKKLFFNAFFSLLYGISRWLLNTNT